MTAVHHLRCWMVIPPLIGVIFLGECIVMSDGLVTPKAIWVPEIQRTWLDFSIFGAWWNILLHHHPDIWRSYEIPVRNCIVTSHLEKPNVYGIASWAIVCLMLPLVQLLLHSFLFFQMETNTLPETNSSSLKIGLPNRKVLFQPSIFRGYVSFREGTNATHCVFAQRCHVLGIHRKYHVGLFKIGLPPNDYWVNVPLCPVMYSLSDVCSLGVPLFGMTPYIHDK